MNTGNKVSLLSTLITLAAGIILCIGYGIDNSIGIIIFVAGASFMIASVVNVVMLCDNRDRDGRRRRSVFNTVIGWIVSVGGIALGVTMLVTPATFTDLLVYMFGIVLVLTAICQAVVFMRGMPGYRFAGWVYILPLLTLADGAVMLFYDLLREEAYRKYVVLMMGVGLIVIALANAILYFTVGSYNRRLRRGEVQLVESRTARGYARDDSDDNPVTPSI